MDRRDFKLIQMDTDSMYMTLSKQTIKEVIRSEVKAEFEDAKKQWLCWNKWSTRERGLFKLEAQGTRADRAV